MDLANILEKWVVFGPIENKGIYPGEVAWKKFAFDGANEIPNEIMIDDKKLERVEVVKTGDVLDFRKIFDNYPTGVPQCYAFCDIEVSEDTTILLSLGADWGAVLWFDGQEILESRKGSPSSSIASFPLRKTIKLTAGKHVLCCRVISGMGGWLLTCRVDMAKSDPGIWGSYLDSGLRLEQRPAPTGVIEGMDTKVYEKTAVSCGVQARWLSVCDQTRLDLTGNSLFKSAYLPVGENYDPEFDQRLKDWVKIIHDLGIPAISWMAMSQNRQGWLENPDWRQVFLVPQGPDDTHQNINVCINSGYGDALIGFCIEAIEKFNLDGFWFDGSAFSSVWNLPMPVSCICESCQAKYKSQTGKDMPLAYEPAKREFREWMLWRYKTYSEYWQRLAKEVKAKYPNATIAVNHYHREGIPWTGAVPLNPFDADIISATEADNDPWKAAFYTRINRAYGRPYSETWITSEVGQYSLDGQRKHNPYPLVTNAVSCLTAGADSSFGGVDFSVSAAAFSKLSEEIDCRKPYRYLDSYPLAALHVSQQTDTFSFGTMPEFTSRTWKDHYWKSLVGWHRLLMSAGLWMDVVFDDHLKIENLKKYKYLFMPLAVALSDNQIETVLKYVREGGKLLTGPWFACQDEWGYSRKREATLKDFMPYGEVLPGYSGFPECLLDDYSKPVSIKKLGEGQIIQFPGDCGTAFRDNPSKEKVDNIRHLINRDSGDVPISLEGPEGIETYAHIGVSYDKNGDIIVAIQQLEPFWSASSVMHERPPVAAHCKLRIYLNDIQRATCEVPGPSYGLDICDRGCYKEIMLPAYTWGVVVRLSKKKDKAGY